MKAEEDPKFKAVRYRFYKLGKYGRDVLTSLGVFTPPGLSKERTKEILFDLHSQGRITDLESMIEKEEARIAKEGY